VIKNNNSNNNTLNVINVCVFGVGEFIIQACDWQGPRQQESRHDPAESSHLLGTNSPQNTPFID